MRRAVRKKSTGDSGFTAFVFHPKFWPNVAALQQYRVVHFVHDALSLSPGWDEIQAEWERQLVERADLIVAYSANILDYMPVRAAEIVKEMPTGVNFAHFVDVQQFPCPADLAGYRLRELAMPDTSIRRSTLSAWSTLFVIHQI